MPNLEADGSITLDGQHIGNVENWKTGSYFKTTSTTTSELGPLKYISNLTGQSMDKIINWFLLIIIFVFDPLAIALVIAANFAFAQIKKDNKPSLEETIESMKNITETYDDLVKEIEKIEEVAETPQMTPEEAKEYAKSTGRRPW
jgi:hypothetical protein